MIDWANRSDRDFNTELNELVTKFLKKAYDDLNSFKKEADNRTEGFEIFSVNFTEDMAHMFDYDLSNLMLEQLIQAQESEEVFHITEYHWLLLDRIIECQFSLLGDMVYEDYFNDCYGDTFGEYFDGKEFKEGISYNDIIDLMFWDTDFDLPKELFSSVVDKDKVKNLGLGEGAYGVIMRMTPHKDELVLTKVK